MELATNTFNKGLLLDTHPIILGNDTLSDALNATFVTMNGNEIILQNDMGNRRIDNAYLPSGYEPVGMKEYGGIIYVAAYNPLTNRGLIGSFPSPLRKLSTGNTELDFCFSNFLNNPNPRESYKIAVDNITIPISGDIVLHTGDKFSIYSNEIGNIIQYLVPTEFLGIKKNNLFSFQIGIFNSQNEFVDISDKLIKLTITVNSKKYEYYITNEEISSYEDTLSDLELLEKRNSLAINTYSYKIASPLYLQMKLNHINSINYTIDGDIEKVSEGTKNVKFYISVTYHYNCVDQIINNENKIEYFKLRFINNNDTSSIKEVSSIEEIKEQEINPIYYEELDEYLLILNYEVDEVLNITDSSYNYTLEFPLLNNFKYFTNDNITIINPILTNLTQNNSINTDLLGSDSIVFSGYRYLFNNESKVVTLELDIESYPKKSGTVYEVIPIIYDPTNENIFYELDPILGENGKSPVSGIYTIMFNYKLKGLEERKLYKIKLLLKYKNETILNNNENETILNNNKDGLFITTPIFNGNYIGNKSFKDGITLKEDGGYDYDIAKDDYISNFKDIKHLILNPIINISYNQHLENITKVVKGKTIYELNESEPIGEQDIEETYKIETTFEPGLTLNNIELYPEELESSLIIYNNEISILIYSRIIDGKEIRNTGTGYYEYYQDLIETKGGFLWPQNSPVIEILETVFEDLKKINTIVTVHNFIKGDLIETSLLCNRVITSLYDFIIKSYFFNDDKTRYSGISDPFVTIDFEGNNGLGIRFDNSPFEDHTYRDDEGTEIAATHTYYKYPLSILNDKMRLKTENLLLLEYNSNDTLIGCPPTFRMSTLDISDLEDGNYLRTSVYDGNALYKRIWLRTSEKEYTPIYAQTCNYSEQDKNILVFGDDNDYFKDTLSKIPHFYAYSEESRTIDRKVIDYNRLMFTKEFDVTSNMQLNLSCLVLLNSQKNYYQINDLYNNGVDVKNFLVSTTVNVKLDNIKSSNLLEELDILDNLELDCVLESPLNNYNLKSLLKEILYKDIDGNFFDSQNMYYYYDYRYNTHSKGGGYKKSYKPKKFYISDLSCEFPELKDSSLLYCDSEGNPHPYVNPYVYKGNEGLRLIYDLTPTVGFTKRILIDPTSLINLSYYDSSGNDYTNLSNKGLLKKDNFHDVENNSTEHYYYVPSYLTILNQVVDCDNKFTMAQYEGNGDRERGWDYSVFTTKNIFDQETIMKYYLYVYEGTNPFPMIPNPFTDAPKRSWKSADEFLLLLTT